MENPTSFKFFGPPLLQTRAMDSIFESVKSYDTLYHRFKCYYDGFEGNVNACVALYNAYLHRKNILLSKQMKKILKDQKNHDGNLFKTAKVKEFIMRVDDKCRAGLELVFSEFKDHSDPIVSTLDMLELIAQAPSISGDTWDLLCKLRGVKVNQPSQKEKNVLLIHSVFYDTMAMARRENRNN